jgi:hypothetical protein
LVSSGYDAPKGTDVSIVLALPGLPKTILLKGLVVRAYRGSFSVERIYHFGVRFNAITPDSMLLVKTVLANRGNYSIVRNDRVYERTPQKVRE